MNRFAIQSRNSNAEQCRIQLMNKSVKQFKNNNVILLLTQSTNKNVILSTNKFAIQFTMKFATVPSQHMVFLAVELEVLLVEVETPVKVQSLAMELLLLQYVDKYPDKNVTMYPVSNARMYQNK